MTSNSFYWAPVVRELALLGHRSLPVDLPGHGLDAPIPPSYQAQDIDAFVASPSPLSAITVQDNVAHVIEVVEQVRRHGPVVLVGHSLGGITIGLVGNAIPDAIHRIVYLSAFCPSTEEAPSAMALSQTPEALKDAPVPDPEHSLFLGPEPISRGIIRFNLRSADPQALEDFRLTNMPEATLDQLLTVMNFGMQPEDAAQTNFADGRVDPDTWGRIPRTYIRLTRDNVITPALATKMIDDADRLTPANPFDVHTLESGHIGAVLRARELATILDRLP
ncbi:alpha/beta hydrolase [Nocardia huaxiensis]|uniref:alpha/beta hydrolase n=1 Tax=Nocardia huaxiensis TaxID=2755382 RepID=UPI001C68077C|nr:alpha/beta fold hydrolase [Nocardia huaxiensis]UFS98317.1 alpha/beta hydrolase [Nocardia huaxiensis]